MNLITTTELRTRTSELIKALLAGESVDLIHRSQILGEIKPKNISQNHLRRKPSNDSKITKNEPPKTY